MKPIDPKESNRALVIEKAVEAMKKNQDVVIVHRTYQVVNDPVEIPSYFFIEAVGNIEYMTEVREAIRSWFCCYIPVYDQTHGPDLDRGAKLYQDLDEFISNLIVAAVQ